MNNRRAPISTLISIISAITIVGFTLLGFLLAVTYGIAESQTRNVNVIAVIFGMILRLGIVFLVGLPISALLSGFAKIVAWYEAVPPGQVCIIQTPDGGSAAVPPGFTGVIRPGTGAARTAHQSPAVPGREPAADFGGRWKCRLCGSIQPNIVSVCPRCGNAHVRFTAPPPSQNEKKNAHPSGPASSAR